MWSEATFVATFLASAVSSMENSFGFLRHIPCTALKAMGSRRSVTHECDQRHMWRSTAAEPRFRDSGIAVQLQRNGDAVAHGVFGAFDLGAAMNGEVADGAVFGLKLGDDVLQSFLASNPDELRNDFATQTVMLVGISNHYGQFGFARERQAGEAADPDD